MTHTPVLEIGGTHVSAALVDTGRWRTVEGTVSRSGLRSDGTVTDILADIVMAAGRLGSLKGSKLGIAMPGPFDYERGIGRFRDVGKFDALDGVNVKRPLLAALHERPDDISFVNDATAFAIGEWVSGAAKGASRMVAITLGTGVGSTFLDDGRPVTSGPDVPSDGFVHLLRIDDRPLEDVVSRRAIVAAYRSAVAQNGSQLDVHDIARLAADGEATARSTLNAAFRALGVALAPWLVSFAADVLVVGGGISAAWEQIALPLREGLADTSLGKSWRADNVICSNDTEESSLVGAAWHAVADPTRGSTNWSHL
jgi:glucokinase